MVSFDVLIQCLTWHDFSKSKHTEELVVALFVMNELVASDSINCGKKGNRKCEAKVIAICSWFGNIEHVSLRIHFITHYYESPNPYKGLKDNKELKRNVKAFVISEKSLGFDR